jgi:hypothetical protein
MREEGHRRRLCRELAGAIDDDVPGGACPVEIPG